MMADYDQEDLLENDLRYREFEYFAERLIDTSMFQHFIDDYLEDDIKNFDVAA